MQHKKKEGDDAQTDAQSGSDYMQCSEDTIRKLIERQEAIGGVWSSCKVSCLIIFQCIPST